MSLPLFPPGPPPPGDGVDAGLREAFRRAHRRRLRTAMTSALPVVAGAVVLSVLPGGGGATSLDDIPPTGRLVVSGSPTAPPTPRADVPGAPLPGAAGGGSLGTGGAGPRSGGAPAGSPAPGGTPDLITLSPRPQPTARRTTGAGPQLRFTAAKTASVRIELPAAVRVRPEGIDLGMDGRFAGVYLVSDDGRTRGGAFRANPSTVGPPLQSPVAVVGSFDVLPAGRYTAYVVADEPVVVTVPLHPQDTGVTATATGPARAWYDQRTDSEAGSPAGARLDARVEIDGGDASSAGVAGVIATGAGRQEVTTEVCLAARTAPCQDGDPAATRTSGVAVATEPHAPWVAIDPGALARPRDVTGSSQAATATADARLVVWYLVVDF